MEQAKKWINIALVNLAIVALLGLLLRAKMIFEIPSVNFKYILHAHSHFAFSGWISLALLTLMVFRLLPPALRRRKVYSRLLGGLLVSSAGMLFSFPFQGYGFYSIVFSTLFILISYAFTRVYLKDFRRSHHSRAVKLLTVSSLSFLVLSSCGPFILAYLMAVRSPDAILYKNAIYTYLHLQYSGFFSLAVFALAFHYLGISDGHALLFSRLLTLSVIPSMFASYLWSRPDGAFFIIAVAGSILSVLCVSALWPMARVMRRKLRSLHPLALRLGALSLFAFLLKMALQSFTVIPLLGAQVFSNRPVIIGFLHLVLLGFVSIYLLAYFVQTKMIRVNLLRRIAVWIFAGGVVFNEIVLMLQGLGTMIMKGSPLFPYLLFAAALLLAAGSCLIVLDLPVRKTRTSEKFQPEQITAGPALNHKTQKNERPVY